MRVKKATKRSIKLDARPDIKGADALAVKLGLVLNSLWNARKENEKQP